MYLELSVQGPSWDIEQPGSKQRGLRSTWSVPTQPAVQIAEAAQDSIHSAGWLCGKALPAGLMAKQLWWQLRMQGGLVPT